MEPILQNPQFTKLLRVWEFITAYYEYLELPQTYGQVSLYELNKHIQHKKHMTSMISQMIEALVKKATGHQKTNKNSTILFMARHNKFNFFNDLVKSSFYELGRSQVNFSLAWRDLPQIDSTLPFQALQIHDKYRYLIGLINLVSTGAHFKNQYLEKIRKQYGEVHQKAGKDKVFLHLNYGVKLGPSLFLGRDLDNNRYFYFSKINDSIFSFNTTKNQWKKIAGQQSIKKQVIDKLVQKPNLLTQHSLDLLQNIQLLWNKLSFPLEHTAFNRNKELFNYKTLNIKQDKLDKIKQKMYELDQQYSKFIGDCYNFRWATKQNRITFRNQVNEAKQMKDLVSCLGTFFHKTKHTIQKKLNTFDIYDYNLSTDDQPQTEFKNMFLRMNYLYVKDVFAESGSSKSFSVNMYSHIKSFLELSDAFQPYLYEYLTTFIECMLGIIRQMYPGAIQRRGKILQKLKKEQKEKEQQQKNEIQGKLTRNRLKKNSQVPSQISSSENDQEQQQQQSSTTADKNQSKALNGRRLRQKVRVDYKITQTNSRSKKIDKPKAKPEKLKLRHQPKRNGRSKQSKMILDSDSDEDQVNISLSESDTQKQDKGLSLDKYKYVEQEDTQKFRRNLRSSKEKN